MSTLPICPRCRLEVPVKWQLHPVRLCLPCYALIPENEGLGYYELRDKAEHSRYASREVRKQRYARERERWATMTPAEREAEDAETADQQAYVADVVQSILNKAGKREPVAPVSKGETDPPKS